MDIKKLNKKADKIPSLGGGGRSIKYYLSSLAKAIRCDSDIVELGSWLGSSTAYLAIGLYQNGFDIDIHCYDKWIADDTYRYRAKKYHNIDFCENENLLPYFMKNVRQFEIEPKIYKDDFKNIKEYNGKPISVAIHDAGCDMEVCNNFMKVFSPHFVPAKTVVLFMDFFYCMRDDKSYKTQFLMAKKNQDAFQYIGRIGKSYTAALMYRGGDIKYLTQEDYE